MTILAVDDTEAKHSHAEFSYGICPHCLEQTARPALEKLLAAKTAHNENPHGGLASPTL
jgi:hypothetical protein